ncbi:MAG: DUF7010 family protein [Phycicoccus sp.]
MDLLESLERLAEQNRSGSGFLAVYGVTWLMCGFVWRRASARVAALATLFQGLVAFPAAVGLSALIGAFDQARPVSDEITQLSVLIGSSQLLGLPFVVYLAVRRHHTLVPFALATITSMHFVFYSWLYRAPVYIALAVSISLGTTAVMLSARQADPSTAGRVSSLTGGLLLVTAAVFLAVD